MMVAEARAIVAEHGLDETVAEIVESAPPLSTEQTERVRAAMADALRDTEEVADDSR